MKAGYRSKEITPELRKELEVIKTLHGNNKQLVGLIENILKNNNLNLQTSNSHSLLEYLSFIAPKHQMEAFFLEMDVENLKSIFLENIFHFLAENPKKTDLMKGLLDIDRKKSEQLLQAVDIYGRTPLEVALEHNNEEAIKLLSEYTQTKVEKKIPPLDISQLNLNAKLANYLILTGRKAEDILEGGQCAGWGFLYQIYASAGNEKEFFDILNIIAQLKVESNLPDTFTHLCATSLPENLKKKYGNIETLLENVISALVLFQATSSSYKSTGINFTQDNLIEAYELVRDPSVNRSLENLSKLVQVALSREQLEYIISFFMLQPETELTFDMYADDQDAAHRTVAHVLKDGRLSYYDSNIDRQIPPITSKDLVEHLIRTNYSDGNLNQTYHMALEVSRFFYNNKKQDYAQPFLPPPFEENNPLGFSKLHYAIVTNDMNLFNEQLLYVNLKDKIGGTPLMWAVRMGNKLMASQLLDKDKANLNERDSFGNTALMLAVKQENIEMVKLLLSHDSEINLRYESGLSIMSMAIFLKNDAIFKLLIDQKNVEGKGLIFLSVVENGTVNMANLLLQKGVDIKQKVIGKTFLNFAIESNNLLLIPFLIKEGCDIKASIDYAVQNNDVKTLRTLQQFGVAFTQGNKENEGILQKAVFLGKVEVVKFLLSIGAGGSDSKSLFELQKKSIIPKIPDEQKAPMREITKLIGDYYFLLKGLETNDESMLKKLLERDIVFDARWVEKITENKPGIRKVLKNIELKSALEKNDLYKINQCIFEGADVNVTTEQGVTALMRAAEQGDVALIEHLIEKKADLNAVDVQQRSALTWASIANKELVLQRLCEEKEIALNKKDFMGNTALDWAWMYDHKKLMTILLRKGASTENKILQHIKEEGDFDFLYEMDSIQPKHREDEKREVLTFTKSNTTQSKDYVESSKKSSQPQEVEKGKESISKSDDTNRELKKPKH